MNYIKNLNAVYVRFIHDERLGAVHISLYMALYQEWNSSRFAAKFYINRHGLMLASKIGSRTTYHKCLRELEQWGYIRYYPSMNPYKGSQVSMISFADKAVPSSQETDHELEAYAERVTRNPIIKKNFQSDPAPVQSPVNSSSIIEQLPDFTSTAGGGDVVHTKKNKKKLKSFNTPQNRQAVVNYFFENDHSEKEADKFLRHYRDAHWKTKSGEPVRDWKALAAYWMDRVFQNKTVQPCQGRDNLKTTKSKSYDQPL